MTGQTQRELHPIVKAADKLSAYIKCIEERKAGNNEFLNAESRRLRRYMLTTCRRQNTHRAFHSCI